MLLDFGESTFATVDATYNVVATKSALVEIFGLDGALVVVRPRANVQPGQLALRLFRLDAGAWPAQLGDTPGKLNRRAERSHGRHSMCLPGRTSPRLP